MGFLPRIKQSSFFLSVHFHSNLPATYSDADYQAIRATLFSRGGET